MLWQNCYLRHVLLCELITNEESLSSIWRWCPLELLRLWKRKEWNLLLDFSVIWRVCEYIWSSSLLNLLFKLHHRLILLVYYLRSRNVFLYCLEIGLVKSKFSLDKMRVLGNFIPNDSF